MRHLKLRTICRGGVHKEIGLNGAAVYKREGTASHLFLENQISDCLNTFLAGLLKKASDAGGCAKTTCR